MKSPITSEILFEDSGLVNPQRRKVSFTPLETLEVLKEGDVVGLDAEFVSLNQVWNSSISKSWFCENISVIIYWTCWSMTYCSIMLNYNFTLCTKFMVPVCQFCTCCYFQIHNKWRMIRVFYVTTVHCWVISGNNLWMDEMKDDSTFRHTLAGCKPTLANCLRFCGRQC